MLNDVRNDLARDIEFCEALLGRIHSIGEASKVLLNSYGEENDSMVLSLYPIMTMGIAYTYHKGAYEALKSTGFDKVSNDTIRTHLSNLYQFWHPRTSKMLYNIEENKVQLIEKLENELIASRLIIDEQGNRSFQHFAKYGNLLMDSRLLRLVEIYQNKAQEETMRIESILNYSEFVLSIFNRELEDHFPRVLTRKERIKSIGILGTATEGEWETDLDMLDKNKDGIYTIETNLGNGDVKFRANDNWEINWGGFRFPLGTGIQEGRNIRVQAGRYNIELNSITGYYQFKKLN
jgi:hypothetical protein